MSTSKHPHFVCVIRDREGNELELISLSDAGHDGEAIKLAGERGRAWIATEGSGRASAIHIVKDGRTLMNLSL